VPVTFASASYSLLGLLGAPCSSGAGCQMSQSTFRVQSSSFHPFLITNTGQTTVVFFVALCASCDQFSGRLFSEAICTDHAELFLGRVILFL
jgi:hypothetical protein